MNTKAIIDAAVECFDLGPEDQDAVLRFGMKLEVMSPWISVKDRFPQREGKQVLTFSPRGVRLDGDYYGYWPHDTTHWMPLPETPRP